MPHTHKVACFLRVDLEVRGEPSGDLYDVISDRLQNIVMEALDGTRADDPELEASTCLVLGPLEPEDELGSSDFDPGTEFDILMGHLEWEDDDGELDGE